MANMIENIHNGHKIPVPEEFYCEKENAPFTHCKLCSKELIESNSEYVIEKAFSKDLRTGKHNVIFELAYCAECMEGVHSELSQESMQNLAMFFQGRTNLEKRNNELIKHQLFETDIWLNNCIINNKDIRNVDEYQVTCLCKGREMIFNHTPYMISGEAMDEIVMLLSNETLDIINDRWDDIVDLPADVIDIFKRRPVFI